MDCVRGSFSDAGEDPWANSPYQWLRLLQSRTRGKAGELLVHRWLSDAGLKVTAGARGAGDRVVNGHRVEVKLSTQWAGAGFRFSQLRDQDYGHALLVGVEPFRLRAWCVPKDLVLAHADGQHTGGTAVETRWFGMPVNAVPEWLAPWGGDSADALAAAVAALQGDSSACCPTR